LNARTNFIRTTPSLQIATSPPLSSYYLRIASL